MSNFGQSGESGGMKMPASQPQQSADAPTPVLSAPNLVQKDQFSDITSLLDKYLANKGVDTATQKGIGTTINYTR